MPAIDEAIREVQARLREHEVGLGFRHSERAKLKLRTRISECSEILGKLRLVRNKEGGENDRV